MTPTEQDKELRKALVVTMYNAQEGKGNKTIGETADIIMQLITADRKRVALEARIDEMNNVRSKWTKPGVGDIKFGRWLHYRQKTFVVDLAELKAQQEEV